MKLHLGSGKRYLNGYVHVDLADFDHMLIQSNYHPHLNYHNPAVIL